MNHCHRCDEPKKGMTKCEGCNQDVCEDCCVKITPHNMVDFPFCIACEELNELQG